MEGTALGPPVAAGKSKAGSCDEKAPDSSDNATTVRSVGWPKGKKRKKVAKDSTDPQKPLTSYVLFFKEQREKVRGEGSSLSYRDLTRKIASDWKALPAEEKQRYADAADEDKDRYAREVSIWIGSIEMSYEPKVAAYKKTEACRNFTSRESKRAKEASTGAVEDGSGFDIPIFTEEFLDHNKVREGELRQLRKSNTDYEQQNASLEKMIENTHTAIGKLEEETLQQRCHNQALLRHLEQMRTTLTEAFSHMPLPGEKDGPTLPTIDNYMTKLSGILDTQTTSSALYTRVRDIVRTLDLHG